MGTSTSASQFAGKLQRAARELDRSEEMTVKDAALAGKAIMLANMGFTRMSGPGKRGARVGVRFKVSGSTALLGYFGPVHLVNNDTSAHRIEPKKKKAIAIAGQPYASADHPGTKGRKFFEKSKPQVKVAAGRVQKRQVTSALGRVF